MTERQKAFIERLVEQRQHPEGEDLTTIGALAFQIAEADEPLNWVATRTASEVIDYLLGLPVAERASTPQSGMSDIAAGRYALVADDGTVKFYIVDRPTEGRWAGYTFLNAQGSEERYPIRDRAERTRILGLIAADPLTAMVRYGHELGRCGNCGRALTDETSRAAGIGPDCAQALGIDRSQYAEIAAAEAAARARGDEHPNRVTGEDDGFAPGAQLATILANGPLYTGTKGRRVAAGAAA